MHILRRIGAGLLLSLLAFISTAHSAESSKGVPMIQGDLVIRKLTNGLTVAVQPDHRFPLASLRLYVHAGSAYEDEPDAGISHVLEHMVFKGTATRPKGRVAEDIEGAGGYLNAATSYDYTVYITDMPADSWKLGMDVLKEQAFEPTLDKEELESEKEVIQAELQRGEDNPSGRLFKRLLSRALAGTTYERPIIGFPETINAVTPESMRRYIERYYQPQSMLLLVVGDVQTEEVMAEAERLFGKLPNTRPVDPARPLGLAPISGKGPEVSVEAADWNKVHLAISFPSYDMNDTRSHALDVLEQLLAGDKTSYFYRKYKYDKQLVDSISASNVAFERLGLFMITATLDADKLEEFWSELFADLPTLAQNLSFSQEELDRARLNIEDGLFRQKETLGGFASKLGYFLFFSGPEAEANYLNQIRHTDSRTLRSLMADIFNRESLSAALLVPSAAKEGTSANPLLPADLEKRLAKTVLSSWPQAEGKTSEYVAAGDGQVEIVDLGKGRTVILQPDTTLPYAALDLVFTGGDSLIGPQDQGLPTLAAAMLSRGTKERSGPQLDAFLADRASSLGAGAGRQTFSLSMRYPARFSSDMFTLLSEVLRAPAFSDEELVRAKQNQKAAIVSQEDQPLGLAYRRLYPFLFGDHPYGYLQTGTREGVDAFSAPDLSRYWKKQAQQPWVLSVCGTFDRDAILALARSLPAPSAATPSLAAPAWTTDKELDLHLPGRQQAHLFYVFPTVPAGHPDEAGLELLQTILSGQSGLLFRDLRDKQGLGYSVTAMTMRLPLTGALMFYIGTTPDSVKTASDGFAKVVADLHQSTLPGLELERGVRQMRGDYVRSHQSLASRSREAASLHILGRPVTAGRDLVDQAASVSPDELRRIARTYLILDKAHTVTVTP